MVVTSLAVNLTSNNVFRHGLTLLWFKDLMNVTEKLQFIDPRFRHPCLVPVAVTTGPFIRPQISCPFLRRGVNRRQIVSRHHYDFKERGRS